MKVITKVQNIFFFFIKLNLSNTECKPLYHVFILLYFVYVSSTSHQSISLDRLPILLVAFLSVVYDPGQNIQGIVLSKIQKIPSFFIPLLITNNSKWL